MNNAEKDIIEAALKLFSEKGYAATSIRDIANEVNMTSASLYYYIKNKKDLLYFIMESYMNQLIESAQSHLKNIDGNDPKTELKHLIKIHVENHARERLAALVVDTEYRSLEGEYKEKIRELRNIYEQIWIDILDRGSKQQVFHVIDSKITAYALLSLCTGIAHWFREDREYTLSQIADQYSEMGLQMVTSMKSTNTI